MRTSGGTEQLGYMLFIVLLLAGCSQPPTESPDWMLGQWTTVDGTPLELNIGPNSIDIFAPGRDGGPDVFIEDRYRVLGTSGPCIRTQRLGDQRVSRTGISSERPTPAPDDRLTFCRRAERQMLVRHIPVRGAASEVLYSRNIAGEIRAALSRLDIAAEVIGSPDQRYVIVRLTQPEGTETVANAAIAISRMSYVKSATPLTAGRAAELVGVTESEFPPQLNLIEVELN